MSDIPARIIKGLRIPISDNFLGLSVNVAENSSLCGGRSDPKDVKYCSGSNACDFDICGDSVLQ
jgi:hypothetical protein